ncbi:VP39 capsid [Spodoptera littoralis nucleopolyhedrovirus]|uniref:VP39 capsid n=1 Tax=Spodoptera littoralis nuclear polyhedrosis virus TaxID=10456 RepID=M1K3W4_NPVSL|nr:VP39 capsid [Spodoptera littoralis nucleopolyhedrovirus]AGE89931.1 VP39 capsid [Spodoptera littoralis nucleopolyhedrovirus]AYU75265.1 VP39 capsid [Spodoptera littoralis nucleopolyhedrovirus]
MALVSGGNANSRMKNYCAFQGVRPIEFNQCSNYRSPCSEDASQNDGVFMCQYHLSRFFKIEKTSIAIPDGTGQKLYRIVGKSLVSHNARANDRILIPTQENYQAVMNVSMLPPAERLVLHLIYNNRTAAAEICNQLRQQENFRSDVVENVTSMVYRIIQITDPEAFCSVVASNDIRSFGNEADMTRTYNSLPPFIKNLINTLVAPEVLTLGNNTFPLKACATVSITTNGLQAVQLYNEVEPKYLYNRNDNILEIRNVIQFIGNSDALNKKLARYECYPLVVQLFLGSQTINQGIRSQAPVEI